MYTNMKEGFTFYNNSKGNNSQLTESSCDLKEHLILCSKWFLYQ